MFNPRGRVVLSPVAKPGSIMWWTSPFSISEPRVCTQERTRKKTTLFPKWVHSYHIMVVPTISREQYHHIRTIFRTDKYAKVLSYPYHIKTRAKHIHIISIWSKQIHIISYHMHKNFNDIIFALLYISETCQILLMSTHFMSNISFLFHTYLMRECKTYTEVVFHFFFSF